MDKYEAGFIMFKLNGYVLKAHCSFTHTLIQASCDTWGYVHTREVSIILSGHSDELFVVGIELKE